MNGFKFRLQTPYNVISWRERLIKQEVKKRQTVYQREEQILNQKLHEMMSLSDQERELKGENVPVESIIVLKELQAMSKVGIRLQQEVVSDVLSLLEESQQQLIEATKEKKSMAKLKEKRYQQFLNEQLRQEQKVIDEVAVQGFWRKKDSYPISEPHQMFIGSDIS